MSVPARLGAYPIERELGRGGMGIVYLGRDPRLGRMVAIKVLPEELSRDPERLSRFDREARLLAALNHPNIAGIHGVEEADGIKFLVLEYVDGETLADRLSRERLSVTDALEICRQIAAALESAHEAGIIHRDLKPGNVKITPAGDVKVLDFGLAKGLASKEVPLDPDLTHSPTKALTGTGEGVIMGTAAYMSPEQARGKSLDRRTDIWSFGCVLFECLTGRRAFEGETATDLIALILQGEPEWSALPARTPVSIRTLLRRSLEKDSKKRLRDIGDARLEIEQALAEKAVGVTAPTRGRVGKMTAILGGLALLLGLSTTWLLVKRVQNNAPIQQVARLSLLSPLRFIDRDAVRVSLSPDGTRLAYVADDSSGSRSLWVRALNGNTLQRLAGNEDAVSPFWSPDGTRLGFFTDRKLKIVDLRSGDVHPLAAITSFGRGASWSKTGDILFSATASGPLMRISERGGPVTQETVLDTTLGETGHRYPCFLPDGRHFLYVGLPPRGGHFNVFIGELGSRERRLLFTAASCPVYASGYLLFDRNGNVAAQGFDPAKQQLVGEPTSLGEASGFSDWAGAPSFTVSQQGTLCILNPPSQRRRLVWYDQEGRALGTVPVPESQYGEVALAPGDRHAVVTKGISPVESDLWMFDLERGASERFTFGPGFVEAPVWSRDGSRVAYAASRSEGFDLYVKNAKGDSEEKLIYASDVVIKAPEDWSPDGRYLLFRQLVEKTAYDLWVLPLDGTKPPFLYVGTPYDERDASFSPDGKWVAYWSSESGQNEVYVRSFPDPSQKFKVSTNGGSAPIWSANGRQMMFAASTMIIPRPLSGTSYKLVDLTPGPEFHVGTGRTVFRFKEPIRAGDVDANLQRVLALVESEEPGRGLFTVVLNWPQILRDRQ